MWIETNQPFIILPFWGVFWIDGFKRQAIKRPSIFYIFVKKHTFPVDVMPPFAQGSQCNFAFCKPKRRVPIFFGGVDPQNGWFYDGSRVYLDDAGRSTRHPKLSKSLDKGKKIRTRMQHQSRSSVAHLGKRNINDQASPYLDPFVCVVDQQTSTFGDEAPDHRWKPRGERIRYQIERNSHNKVFRILSIHFKWLDFHTFVFFRGRGWSKHLGLLVVLIKVHCPLLFCACEEEISMRCPVTTLDNQLDPRCFRANAFGGFLVLHRAISHAANKKEKSTQKSASRQGSAKHTN